MVLKTLLQIIGMASDLVVLFMVALVFYSFGFWAGLITLALAHCATERVGGWFYSWKPANIKAFWRNFPS